jgi:hypothetical protein
MISIFRDEKFWANAEAGSIPGLATTKSYLPESDRPLARKSTRMLCARRLSIVDLSSLFSSALSGR